MSGASDIAQAAIEYNAAHPPLKGDPGPYKVQPLREHSYHELYHPAAAWDDSPDQSDRTWEVAWACAVSATMRGTRPFELMSGFKTDNLMAVAGQFLPAAIADVQRTWQTAAMVQAGTPAVGSEVRWHPPTPYHPQWFPVATPDSEWFQLSRRAWAILSLYALERESLGYAVE